MGLVATNLGHPIVRGQQQRLTFVPGATWHPSPAPALAFSAAAGITPDSVASYAFGVSWRTAGQRPIEILARLDTDGGLRRAAFALGLSIGGQDRICAPVTSPAQASRIAGARLSGVSMRQPVPSRRCDG